MVSEVIEQRVVLLYAKIIILTGIGTTDAIASGAGERGTQHHVNEMLAESLIPVGEVFPLIIHAVVGTTAQ